MNTAGPGIRSRLSVWLVLVTLPIPLSSTATVLVIEARLSDRIETDLMNVRRLEAARITDVPSGYRREAASLANDADVHRSLAALVDRDADRGVGESADEDADPAAPLSALADSLARSAALLGSEIVAVDIVDRAGRSLGHSSIHSWTPRDPALVRRAMDTATTLFGEAFRAPTGEHRLGMAAPVRTTNGRTLGALLLETRLAPVVDPVLEHEGFGDTSEAHIAQPTASGDAQFITLLRFARDAAFDKVVPASKGLPINQALHSPGGRLVNAKDYRGIDSILALETIAGTGWSLVVKIDRAESFAPLAEVKRFVLLAGIASAAVALLGWVVFLHPLARRLSGVARAAERIAAGDLRTMLADPTGDEIGHIARSIDKLAADLVTDRRERGLAEEKLVAQATRDELTGLLNRQHGNAVVDELGRASRTAPTSVLFLDLDGFKAVNDSAGHAAGDEILVAVARRLEGVLDERAVPVRWGGDEFVVVLPGAEADAAERVRRRVLSIFGEPVRTSFGAYRIGCSVGVGTSGDGRALDEVLHAADASMYAQKRRRRESRGSAGDRPDALALRAAGVAGRAALRRGDRGDRRAERGGDRPPARRGRAHRAGRRRHRALEPGSARRSRARRRQGRPALGHRSVRSGDARHGAVAGRCRGGGGGGGGAGADGAPRGVDAVLPAVIRLCRDMHVDIVIEGVETAAQVRALRDVAPVLLQGYRFAPALAGGTFITVWGLPPDARRDVGLARAA